MPVIINKRGGKAVIRVTNASETITLANLQLAGETVREAHITAIHWSGPCTVTRNAVLILNLTDGQDSWDMRGDIALNEQGNQSIAVVATAATIIMEVNKITADEQ